MYLEGFFKEGDTQGLRREKGSLFSKEHYRISGSHILKAIFGGSQYLQGYKTTAAQWGKWTGIREEAGNSQVEM